MQNFHFWFLLIELLINYLNFLLFFFFFLKYYFVLCFHFQPKMLFISFRFDQKSCYFLYYFYMNKVVCVSFSFIFFHFHFIFIFNFSSFFFWVWAKVFEFSSLEFRFFRFWRAELISIIKIFGSIANSAKERNTQTRMRAGKRMKSKY